MTTRYFFDTADGDNDIDDSGVELASDDAALREAVRFAGSMIQDRPDMLAVEAVFAVHVRRENGPRLATVRIEVIRTPAG